MRFSGNARLDGIAEVVASVKSIPVIGNGDVKTPDDARRMFEHTQCAGIMIGRGALGTPWVFRQISSALQTGVADTEPTLAEKCDLMRMHFYGMIKHRNLHAALCEFRKRISWYAKTMHPCSRLRERMRLVESEAQFEEILREFLDWRTERDALKRSAAFQPDLHDVETPSTEQPANALA
jgi:tRNA-dihydrouridine synthase